MGTRTSLTGAMAQTDIQEGDTVKSEALEFSAVGPGMEVQTFNPSTQETELKGAL